MYTYIYIYIHIYMPHSASLPPHHTLATPDIASRPTPVGGVAQEIEEQRYTGACMGVHTDICAHIHDYIYVYIYLYIYPRGGK